MNYFIKEPSFQSNTVEFWSDIRLPFQGNGSIKAMRDSLVEAIFQMNPNKNNILRASYHSKLKDFCDLENILLYNIEKPAVFKKLCRGGISLERTFDFGPCLGISGNAFPHYHRYELVNKPYIRHWRVQKILAHWENISISKITTDTKPAEYWKALKEDQISVLDEVSDGFFGIDIEIKIQEKSGFNLVSVIKPLLDGIIASFHAHQGENLELVSKRLAKSVDVDRQYIENLLLNKSQAVLGMRNLIHPYQNNIKWNPADERCMVINIICNKNHEKKSPEISGRLFTLI